MYENEFQERVADKIIDNPGSATDTENVTAKITDNERAVIVEVDGVDAAYTADEARELARSIETNSHQRWSFVPTDLIQHIRDCADVVDGKKELHEVKDE